MSVIVALVIGHLPEVLRSIIAAFLSTVIPLGISTTGSLIKVNETGH